MELTSVSFLWLHGPIWMLQIPIKLWSGIHGGVRPDLGFSTLRAWLLVGIHGGVRPDLGFSTHGGVRPDLGSWLLTGSQSGSMQQFPDTWAPAAPATER